MKKRIFTLAFCLFLLCTLSAQTFRDRLLPTEESYGFNMPNYWVWCGSVIKGDDGKYHMYASRWPKSIGFNHWLTNSEIVHATSNTPEGPYTFSDVCLSPRGEQYWDGKMTHNPAIRKVGDTYLLYYTGTTYKGDLPDSLHQINNESPKKIEAHHNERIGLATSKSPYGPWARSDKPILDVVPNSWEQYLVSNPAPFILEDGKVMLYYKGVEKLKTHAISVAFADSFAGPYKRISDKPLDMGVDAEDPTIWLENGKFNALMLDYGRKFSDKEIYYATSKDGLKWSVEANPVAVTKNILLKNGKTVKRGGTERPWVLTEDGKATHVFFATNNNGEKKEDSHSWNMCIPLKKTQECKNNTQWFRDAGFGMFIHFGLYSVAGGVWKGNTLKDERYINPLTEHIMLLDKIPVKEYATLTNSFNPTNFDADAIVDLAKQAGMKYLVFTSKHHDGFAMFDSKVSDYNILNKTPYKKDPVKSLADACHKAGIKFGLYYSLGRDWETPDAISREPRRNYWDFPNTTGHSYQKYLDEKVKPQITELLSNYGQVDILWFDTPELTTRKQSIELELLIKRLQPNCIVNTRIGTDGVGDFEEMADNRIPKSELQKPWECPATMSESWGYSVLDTKDYWKSSDELIEKLVEIRAKGGNYLLNIGPDAKGEVIPLATERLKEISKWMQVNGDAIYNTTPANGKINLHNTYIMQNTKNLFVCINKKPTNNIVMLYLDPSSVKDVVLLTPEGEVQLKYQETKGQGVMINLPEKLPFNSISVIRIGKTKEDNKDLEIKD